MFENLKRLFEPSVVLNPPRFQRPPPPKAPPPKKKIPERVIVTVTKEDTAAFTAISNSIQGLQQAIRSLNEQIYQMSELLGKTTQEFEFEKNKVRRLQTEMEQVYDYINKTTV